MRIVYFLLGFLAISTSAARAEALDSLPTNVQDRAISDFRTRPSWHVFGFYGQSALVLGSEDSRLGGGLAIGYGKPEPRFRYGSIPAQLVVEGYVDRTISLLKRKPSPDTNSVGTLVYSRWRWNLNEHGWGMYLDLGWGLQYSSQPSVDLDNHLNSTPMLGFGGTFRFGTQEFLAGIRVLHISNGGSNKPNQGQNQIFLTLGVRF